MKKANLLLAALFVASTTTFAQMRVSNNGNVGIGTTNPQHRLDVFGDMRISGRINMGSNTTVGTNTLVINTGHSNTAIGNGAMTWNETGNNNTAIGTHALIANAWGNNNTAIGFNAGVSSEDLNNITVIGNGALVTQSNTIRIGNNSVISASIGTIWSTTSDGRAKTNIRTNVPGLDFINQLQPVTYNMNLDVLDELMKIGRTEKNDREVSSEILEQEREAREFKQNIVQTGFLAQDVEKAAKALGYDFNGVDVDGMGIYGLRYAAFVVPLVRAVQELSGQNDRLMETVREINEQNDRLQKQLNELNARMERNEDVVIKNNAAPSASEQPVFNNLVTTGNPAILHQNIPNPFSQATQINYYVPENVTTAYLCIYDLQGRQLRQVTLTQRGAGSEIISGSQFSPGIYLYALIADGQEVDVKRMILTE